jgi:hypothetical protein
MKIHPIRLPVMFSTCREPDVKIITQKESRVAK